MAPTSILFYKEVGHSQEGAKEVTKLLEAGTFDGPKPVRLLNRILTLANTDKDSLILDEENCIHEGNITFLKKPIRVQFEELLAGILDKTAIVKENQDGFFLYLFALAETKRYHETLRDYYESNHCDQYDCFGVKGYLTGWEKYEDFHVLR